LLATIYRLLGFDPNTTLSDRLNVIREMLA
jgi:hypothetical protein